MSETTRQTTPASKGGSWIRPAKRLAIYLRDGLACTYCGCGLEVGFETTLDHVVPPGLGGTNEAKNLVTACRPCNSRKQDLPLRHFLQVLRDEGVDTAEISGRIRRRTRRSLKAHKVAAKALIASR